MQFQVEFHHAAAADHCVVVLHFGTPPLPLHSNPPVAQIGSTKQMVKANQIKLGSMEPDTEGGEGAKAAGTSTERMVLIVQSVSSAGPGQSYLVWACEITNAQSLNGGGGGLIINDNKPKYCIMDCTLLTGI